MSKTTKLISDLYSGIIDKDRFIQQYFEDKQVNDEYLLNLFDEAIARKDSGLIDEAMVLISMADFTASIFVDRLCELLSLDWHRRHEDVASKLKDIADPDCVDCLFRAAELQFDYLGYDETFQFARKCIKAIAGVDGQNAVSKLLLLTKSSNTVIAEYALKELRCKRQSKNQV